MSADLSRNKDQSEPRSTPLYDEHKALGARFTEFSGWRMPVSYSGLVDEHLAVRNAAGLFDVSHMGEIFVSGPKASDFLQYVATNDLAKLRDGEAQYSLLLNEKGGVVDDIIIYRIAAENYLLCVNAGNAEKDWTWLNECNKDFGAQLENASQDFGQVAVQGPKARTIVQRYLGNGADLSQAAFRPFTFRSMTVQFQSGPAELIIACTGYTGEDGFEIFCPVEQLVELWRELLRAGAEDGLKPAGLGARDTLRLEACYPLHGHEICDDLTPLGAGLGWVINFEKPFLGKDALLREKESGSAARLVGLEVIDPGIVREGARIFSSAGSEIGWVTSGTKPPTVQRSVALGFVPAEFATLGTSLTAEVRGKHLKLKVIRKPFYKRQ